MLDFRGVNDDHSSRCVLGVLKQCVFHHSLWISSVCYAGFTLYVSDLYLWSVYDGYQVLIVWWRAKSPLDISKHTMNYRGLVIISWVSFWDSLVTISPTWKPQQPGCSHKQWWNKRVFFHNLESSNSPFFRVSIRGYLWGFREPSHVQVKMALQLMLNRCATELLTQNCPLKKV